jgi:hypothetical protein
MLAASTPRRVEAISHALAAILAPAMESYRPLLKSAGATDIGAAARLVDPLRIRGKPPRGAARSRSSPQPRHQVEELDEGTIRQLVPGLRPVRCGVSCFPTASTRSIPIG